jgi:DNA-binding transcriptional LysR family regulator
MDTQQALHCFCRVVETGSLAAAARDLDLSPSVVTKTVQSLEDWTASRLLARTTRRMQLTEAGERFYAYARRVLADTEQTLASIRAARGEVSGRLVIASPVSLTIAFLAEHLHAFQAAHPAVELELRLSDRPVDLVREGVDVALRGQAQLDDSSLVAAPLMVMQRTLAAAPAYWGRHGKPSHPSELARLNCLPYLLGSDALRWQFDGPDGRHHVDVRGSFRADNSLLLVDALLRGIGVGLVPTVMMAAPLADGRLEAALPEYRTEPRSLHAVYASREHLPERVRSFVRFLKDRLAQA